MQRLFLRAFADCDSAELVTGIVHRILMSIPGQILAELHAIPKPYWKHPRQFEFTFNFLPTSTTSFQDLLVLSSGGWHHSECRGELSSVWNRGQDHAFLVPEVCWAELQLFEAQSQSRMPSC